MKKLAFAITAVAVVLFVAGCACQTPPAKPMTKHKVHKTYNSKFGKMSAKKDMKK